MNAILDRVSPSITSMIRLDHKHVLAIFRRYSAETSSRRKQALVGNACLALEIHAQLEEEIFYPALQAAVQGDDILDKSVAEHDEMRRLIALLRAQRVGDPAFEAALLELMREVMHHVADEETALLPLAERVLARELGSLGVQMTRRRMALLKPHAGEAIATTARAFPVASVLLGAGALALGALVLRNPASRKAAVGALALLARNKGAAALRRGMHR